MIEKIQRISCDRQMDIPIIANDLLTGLEAEQALELGEWTAGLSSPSVNAA